MVSPRPRRDISWQVRSPSSSPQQTRRRRPTSPATNRLNLLDRSIALIALCLLISFIALLTSHIETSDNTKKDTKAAISSFLPNEDRGDESPSLLSSSYKQVAGIRKSKEADERDTKTRIDKFCGACQWKDTPYTCNERVSFEVVYGFEVEKKIVSVEEAKIAIIEFCSEETEHQIDVYEDEDVTATAFTIDKFCGTCQWKDADFTCNERVSFEVKEGKVSMEEAMIANLEFCHSDTQDHINAIEDGTPVRDGTALELGLSDFCGICMWKDSPKFSCTARVLYEVKTLGRSINEAKMANLEYCFHPSGRLARDKGDFILSPICGGCNRAKNGTFAGTEYNRARGLEPDTFGVECNFLQRLELQKIMTEAKNKNNITIVEKIMESNKVVAQKFKAAELTPSLLLDNQYGCCSFGYYNV